MKRKEKRTKLRSTPARPAHIDLPGDWYVIHSYSGYENKVKANLETRIHSMHMEGEIFDVVIPMEDVVEIKGGRKVTVPKKVFPGYILVRMYLTDDSWFAVRNTPGVTGFVGSATKPVPALAPRSRDASSVSRKRRRSARPLPVSSRPGGSARRCASSTARLPTSTASSRRSTSTSPRCVVLVNIFGRETPVELNFEHSEALSQRCVAVALPCSAATNRF